MGKLDRTPTRVAIIISIVFSTIVLCYIAYSIKRRIALNGKVRYTIGTNTGIQFSSSGRDVKYMYKVNSVMYNDVTTYAYNSQPEGGFYLVKISVDYPSISELYQNRPIPLEY